MIQVTPWCVVKRENIYIILVTHLMNKLASSLVCVFLPRGSNFK